MTTTSTTTTGKLRPRLAADRALITVTPGAGVATFDQLQAERRTGQRNR